MAAGGCAALLQIDAVVYTGVDAGPDAATGNEGGPHLDGGADAIVFNPIDEPRFWKFSDAYAGDGGVFGYSGAVFDGRWLYLVPSGSGAVVRYDTTTDFGPTGTWESFDVGASVDASPSAPFSGAAFDGRYVYFAPGPSDSSGVVRYDTHGAFTASASWETFYLEEIDPRLKGYRGAAFRDPYVYFVPEYNAATSDHGNVVRFDRAKSFTAASSWEFTDLKAGLGPAARGFAGAVVARDALFLVPGWLSTSAPPNQVARYDFSAPFAADAGGWTLSDVGASIFYGGVYDGRYVYLAPCCADEFVAAIGRYAARFDTQGPAGAQWTLANTTMLDVPQPSSSTAVFDGRRVYFVPSYLRTGPNLGESGVVTTFDTTGSFVTKAAWTQFDLVQIDPRAKSFRIAAFDGRHVYFLPAGSNGRIARFDARDTRAAFDLSFASFF